MKILIVSIAVVILLALVVVFGISYEEPESEQIHKSDLYSVRFYEERLVVQTSQRNNDGFRSLFRYISGENEQSVKIDMTTPVTETGSGLGSTMQFYLPSGFDELNTPSPTNPRVQLSKIPAGYYAVLSYAGSSNEQNFAKHLDLLETELIKDNVDITGPHIKATYNGPFTPPPLRKNEVMYPIHWEY